MTLPTLHGLSPRSLAREGETAGWDEFFEDGFDICVGLVGDHALGSKSLEDVRVLGSNVIKVELFEFSNISGLDLVEVTSDTGIKDANLLLSWHWHVLSLFQELGKLLTSVKELLGGSIKIGTELGEGSDLSVLGEIKLHSTGHLLHGLDLGGRADSRY